MLHTPGTGFAVVAATPVRRLAVYGEIDIATAPDLDRFLRRELGATAPGGAVVVDLAEVRLLAAAGVDVLVRAADGARARGVGFVLDPVSRAVARVLAVCGVDPLQPR